MEPKADGSDGTRDAAARWEKAKEVLDRALDLDDPRERTSFLDRSCAGDGELRREVEALLAEEGRLGGFLTTPIFSLHAGEDDPPEDPNLGRLVGPYRLVRQLGRGGMGAVYLAERADGQFAQTVAVKLIKRGMDTDEILRRFRNERQILAGLAHEHVARFYDGGTTDDGLPYFVMEYVEGEPIDRYCDARRLSVTRRLKLFHAVCEAVQVAHQNLIVHRDLKPANILITPDGAPKLLDFGIAKLLAPAGHGGPGSAALGAPTVLGQLPLTPGYASPEQLRGEPVTTASDVYSLGVLLYELLTGHRPHEAPTERPDAWERLISEAEPARPSTAVRRPREVRLPGGETVTLTPEAVAEAREADPARLRRRLAGDLDTVVMTALARERERRYATAEQLAEDVRRHLEDLPVRARTPTYRYRAGKFVRRYAWQVGGAAAAVLLLIAFGVTMAVQRQRTAVERDRAEAATEYVVEVFEHADPAQARGEEITLREALDLGMEVIESGPTNQPLIRATLLDAVGRVYHHLGQTEQAGDLLAEALRLRREELVEDHPAVAESLQHLALLRWNDSEVDEVEGMFRQAVEILRRHKGRDGLGLAEGLHNLGSYLVSQGRLDEAEGLLLEALAIKRRTLPDEEPRVAITLAALGDLHQNRGDLARAESLFRRVLEIRRGKYGHKAHPELATAVNNLAVVLEKRGKVDEAGRLYRESLEIRRGLYRDGHDYVAVAHNNLADFLQGQGDHEEGEHHFARALDIFRGNHGDDFSLVAAVRRNLATLHADREDHAACEQEAREALRIYAEISPDSWRVADARSVLGGCLVGQGRHEEAEAHLVESLPAILAAKGEEERQTRDARARLVKLYEAWGKPELADRYRAE